MSDISDSQERTLKELSGAAQMARYNADRAVEQVEKMGQKLANLQQAVVETQASLELAQAQVGPLTDLANHAEGELSQAEQVIEQENLGPVAQSGVGAHDATVVVTQEG